MNLGHHHEVNRRIAESTRYEIMTPELAAGYLARNVAFNRSRSNILLLDKCVGALAVFRWR